MLYFQGDAWNSVGSQCAGRTVGILTIKYHFVEYVRKYIVFLPPMLSPSANRGSNLGTEPIGALKLPTLSDT